MRKLRIARTWRALFTQRRRLSARTRPAEIRIMDIEHINAIGKHIADLSERTTALRGYL